MFTRQETLIQLNSVNKYYRTGYGKVHALKDAGFEVRRGEALAIIGSSGSGKSTLLHILGCLDTDYQGEYLLDGVGIRGLSRKKLADIRSRKIGFIFQKYNLVPELSVYENVELPLIYQKVPKAEREERTDRVIRLVGLEDKKRSGWWDWRIRKGPVPTSFPADSSSGSPLPGLWRPVRISCWPTSPRELWTAQPGRRSWTCC